MKGGVLATMQVRLKGSAVQTYRVAGTSLDGKAWIVYGANGLASADMMLLPKGECEQVEEHDEWEDVTAMCRIELGMLVCHVRRPGALMPEQVALLADGYRFRREPVWRKKCCPPGSPHVMEIPQGKLEPGEALRVERRR